MSAPAIKFESDGSFTIRFRVRAALWWGMIGVVLFLPMGAYPFLSDVSLRCLLAGSREPHCFLLPAAPTFLEVFILYALAFLMLAPGLLSLGNVMAALILSSRAGVSGGKNGIIFQSVTGRTHVAWSGVLGLFRQRREVKLQSYHELLVRMTLAARPKSWVSRLRQDHVGDVLFASSMFTPRDVPPHYIAYLIAEITPRLKIDLGDFRPEEHDVLWRPEILAQRLRQQHHAGAIDVALYRARKARDGGDVRRAAAWEKVANLLSRPAP